MDAGARDDAECAICRQYVHLCAVECDCCPGRRTCLRHAAALCECAPGRWRLAFRLSLGELAAVAEEVAARVPAGAPKALKPCHTLYIGFRPHVPAPRGRAGRVPARPLAPGLPPLAGRAGGGGGGGGCARAGRRAF